MTDLARELDAGDPAPLPDLVLYTRPGCHLCDETRTVVEVLLAERTAQRRPTARLVERDITTNRDWERANFTTIPVLELGDARVELATSPARIRRLLESLG
jgi:hypothetical protein